MKLVDIKNALSGVKVNTAEPIQELSEKFLDEVGGGWRRVIWRRTIWSRRL